MINPSVCGYIHDEGLYIDNNDSFVGIASNIKSAEDLFYRYYDIVLCIDVPRCEYCTTLVQAEKFFNGEINCV